MKRHLLILAACLALLSCTKEAASLSGTAWQGETVEENTRKTFAVEFGKTTCSYTYSEYTVGELGPATYSTAAPDAPYTFRNNEVTIEYSGQVSYMGPGDIQPAESYPDFRGTLQGDVLEMTVRGAVFRLRRF